MKGKFITTQILLACYRKLPAKRKDIHTELAETLFERKELLRRLQAKLEDQQKSIVRDMQQKPAA